MGLAVLLLVAAGVGWIGLHAGVTTVKQRVRAHGIAIIIVRYLAGQPFHGTPLTDATWSTRASRALTPTGHARKFWHLPQRTRAARRCGRVFGTLLAGWGLIFHRERTIVALSIGAALLTGIGIWRAVAWSRKVKHHRTWMYPAHVTAAPLAGISLTAAPGDWLEIAPDRSRVVAELPADFNADAKQRQRLVETLTGKLGIEAPDVKWALAGPKPRLELVQSQPPPARVTLADAMTVIESARNDELVWGAGRRGSWVKTSLSGDSPHAGLSMGSGAGKSACARSLLAQQLHKGAIGLILDYKMISHQWAAGLPNVVIARRPAEIHAALRWLGREVTRRNEVALAGADVDGNVRALVGPRLVVVCEELNATISALRAYWRGEREGSDPVRSPALESLDEASFMGRQVRMNLIYIGQRLSDKATGGGGDARENMSVIAFCRQRPSTWKMLVPDFAMPPRNLTPGRLQVVSDQVQEAQGIWMTPLEAREFAVSGAVSPLPSGMPGAPATVEADSVAGELVSGPDLGMKQFQRPVPVLPASGGVVLSEARETLFPDLTIAGLRTLRHRDKTFPPHIGRRGLALEYDYDALAVYAAGRKE